MIPNPILKVLLTLSFHEVRHLLMGGQACVFYGAAEFSRDCDIVILADKKNLLRLESALMELQADCIEKRTGGRETVRRRILETAPSGTRDVAIKKTARQIAGSTKRLEFNR